MLIHNSYKITSGLLRLVIEAAEIIRRSVRGPWYLTSQLFYAIEPIFFPGMSKKETSIVCTRKLNYFGSHKLDAVLLMLKQDL